MSDCLLGATRAAIVGLKTGGPWHRWITNNGPCEVLLTGTVSGKGLVQAPRVRCGQRIVDSSEMATFAGRRPLLLPLGPDVVSDKRLDLAKTGNSFPEATGRGRVDSHRKNVDVDVMGSVARPIEEMVVCSFRVVHKMIRLVLIARGSWQLKIH